MDIFRAGSRPSAKAPGEYFTGTVRIDPMVEGQSPSSMRGNMVTFEPGARTAWHTHPMGQAIVVMSGLGLAQKRGGPIEEIRPGDVVWFAPDEVHWHGASPATAMSHLAIQEAKDGSYVTWMEHVTDQEYGAR